MAGQVCCSVFYKCYDVNPLVGSFLEFLPIMSILRERYTPATLPYHIIVSSLPGYAFSSAPPLDRDFQLQDIARLMNKLMLQLGFEHGYAVQGG